jgi:hypothetical protein
MGGFENGRRGCYGASGLRRGLSVSVRNVYGDVVSLSRRCKAAGDGWGICNFS